MRELALVMPEGSWLRTANATMAGDAAADAAATTTPSGPSATLAGCTPRHSDVAAMMVRLRQLHRVVDVELTSSTRGLEGGTAAPDSCGLNTSFDITLTFSPGAPADEAPRGAQRVPASLGGGS
jgi:hypothetical protein